MTSGLCGADLRKCLTAGSEHSSVFQKFPAGQGKGVFRH